MKRIRLNKLVNSSLFVVNTAKPSNGLYLFSHHLHSFLSTNIPESIADHIRDADVIDIEVFTTIQLPK